MSSLADGPFGSLAPCALDCFSSALADSACAASNITCLCMDTTFFNQATGCTTKTCGVKAGLTATNLTMSTCEVPQASQADVSPILAGILGMLALMIVIVRVIQRTVFRQNFGWDDGLIVGALVCAAPLNCLMFPMQNVGLGTNIWTIPFDHITQQLQYLYIAETCYMAAEGLTQLSFLTFYMRIFQVQKLQWIAYTLMVLSACFGISNTFVMIFQCTPVWFFWKGWTGEYKGTCIHVNTYSWYKAAMQIAMDLAIISLPIKPLMQLTLDKKKKTQLFLMFCTGFLITVVSCLRLQSLVKFSKSSNLTYDNTPAVYWSVVECDIAIICACMPFLPSLLRHMFPQVFGQPSVKQYNNMNHEDTESGSAALCEISKDTWHSSSADSTSVRSPEPAKTPATKTVAA